MDPVDKFSAGVSENVGADVKLSASFAPVSGERGRGSWDQQRRLETITAECVAKSRAKVSCYIGHRCSNLYKLTS